MVLFTSSSAWKWLSCCMLLPVVASQSLSLTEDEQICLEDTFSACGIDYERFIEANTPSNSNSTSSRTLRILSFDTGSMDLMGRKAAAEKFFEKTGVTIYFDLVPDFLGTYDEIRSQLQGKLPLYDGFICGPAIVGTAVQLDGFLDLTEYVRDNRELQWLDVLRGFRENIAVYDNSVRMFPLDGDAHFMFYRSDVLDYFGQSVPRTWDEYWQVAKAVHGKQYKNRTIYGSCVGMKQGVHLGYWASLILSSYTQTSGASQGFILDAQNLSPLMGEAMAEVLKMLEYQAMYSHPDVFDMCGGGDPCSINIQAMNAGECALTYNWGDSYKASHALESQAIGLIQSAPTPGTKKILNRQTLKLEDCNENTCGAHKGGIFYEDIGWVNRASYLAFGGWSGAINNNIDDAQKELILDYFTFMAGPQVSGEAAIPNASTATLIPNGVDPFRTSHLQADKWVAQGFERNSAEAYLAAVQETLNHPNAAYDMRFAGSDLIFSAIEDFTFKYLQEAVVRDEIPKDEAKRQEFRVMVAKELEMEMRKIVQTEDAKPETLVPILEQYQRDLGIYKPPSENNSNTTLAISIPIVVAILLAAALLAFFKHKNGKNDAVWKIKKEELHFADPPAVIGSGSFGLVVLAEYRGTQVAVKRVIPSSKKTSRSSGSNSGVGKISGSMDGMQSGDGIGVRSSTLNGSQDGLNGTIAFKSKSVKALTQDFVKEIRFVSQLKHPCICTVMGAVISPGEQPMLVMEYMDLGSLYDILHNMSIPLEGEVLLPMLCDISQGCRFLHASEPEVIHGDLKSANILVDSRFRAKVADFGLSQKQRLGATGTPYWMAPELLRREGPNTKESDVYSFGIILIEAFSRKDPYEGEDYKQVLKEVADVNTNKRPPVPQDCSEQMAAIIKDCLLANPEERPSFEELDKRLRRVEPKAAETEVNKVKTSVSLFDIFPKHIAEALRDGKQVEAEQKDVVTIFFSDIVGFTNISATMKPQKVANMLDRLYSEFDALSDFHDIFKVETIGDAYMAVSNLTKDQAEDHATRIADFAVNAIQAANKILIDPDAPEKGTVQLRVGFHSGPVVADVVGSRNPRYCLFGDTVNTASRMESTSMANRVHCSKAAADLLKKENCKLPVTSRGKIKVKGKGEMHTFWVGETGSALNDDDVPESALLVGKYPPVEDIESAVDILRSSSRREGEAVDV